jgi:hypothetical protein
MRWLSLCLALCCCAHADPGQVAAAVSAIAVAGTASAVSVANGGCAATCVYGTFCNEKGMCEALPCHASCNYNEVCERDPVEHCVPIRAAQMQPLQLNELPPPPPGQ